MDPTEQQIRADFIDHLYERSGRTNGLYTGLWHEFRAKVAEKFVDELANTAREQWAFWSICND